MVTINHALTVVSRKWIYYLSSRWASHGLDFLTVACQPGVLAALTEKEFQVGLRLKGNVFSATKIISYNYKKITIFIKLIKTECLGHEKVGACCLSSPVLIYLGKVLAQNLSCTHLLYLV